jgi:hypothetical protein
VTSETATNINGIEFTLRRLKTSATIRLAQELEDRRLTFIEARLADGTTLRPMGSNWGQHHWTGLDFGRVDSEGRLYLGDPPAQDMIVTVAVHENVPIEFLCRPTLLPE